MYLVTGSDSRQLLQMHLYPSLLLPFSYVQTPMQILQDSACVAVHTQEVLCLSREAAADALCSSLHWSGVAAEQLSLFCTVLFFLQNCLWQFVLILITQGFCKQ